ncbi:MAG: hypothetical protein ACRCR7_03135, partial [Weissella cibaria]
MPIAKSETQKNSAQQDEKLSTVIQKMADLSLQQGATPQKFRPGDNFHDWERATRRYLSLFPATQWEQRLYNCFST